MRGRSKLSRMVWNVVVLLKILGGLTVVCFGADLSPKNLALSALGAKAHTWEPGVTVVP